MPYSSYTPIAVIPGLRLGQMPPDLAAVPLQPRVRRRISAAFRQGERTHPGIRAVVQSLQRAAQALTPRPPSPG